MAINYKMGFAINGVAIPDPSGFKINVSALDTSAERDATGLLHRTMVAVKRNLKIEWKMLSWDMIREILNLTYGDRFTFTYPDPKDGVVNITAYTGDRETEVTKIDIHTGEYFGPLSFSVIEF